MDQTLHRVAAKEREKIKAHDQIEDGKMTKQGKMEPSGTGKHQTEDNGRH